MSKLDEFCEMFSNNVDCNFEGPGDECPLASTCGNPAELKMRILEMVREDQKEFTEAAIKRAFSGVFPINENMEIVPAAESKQSPDYYTRTFKGMKIQVNDVTHLWDLDSDEAQAVQYILRAQYKNDGADEIQDLRKAVDMLEMAIRWKEKS